MKSATYIISESDAKSLTGRRLRARKDGMVAVTLNRAERRRLTLAGVKVQKEGA